MLQIRARISKQIKLEYKPKATPNHHDLTIPAESIQQTLVSKTDAAATHPSYQNLNSRKADHNLEVSQRSVPEASFARFSGMPSRMLEARGLGALDPPKHYRWERPRRALKHDPWCPILRPLILKMLPIAFTASTSTHQLPFPHYSLPTFAKSSELANGLGAGVACSL